MGICTTPHIDIHMLNPAITLTSIPEHHKHTASQDPHTMIR